MTSRIACALKNFASLSACGMFGRSRSFNVVPMVSERTGGEQSMDIWSLLLRERIVFLQGSVTDECAASLIAQMIYLESVNHTESIQMYINSAGGSVSAGLAIYDTMNYIEAPVQTLVAGKAESMAAVLLCAGEPGMRSALPNSRIMLHQPCAYPRDGWVGTSDVVLRANRVKDSKTTITGIVAKHTGQPYDVLERKMDRNCWLTPEDAVHLGIVDKVVAEREPCSVN
jgi:ATP-dependent Clp protease, protease subunit